MQAIALLHAYLQRDWFLFVGMIATFFSCLAVTLASFIGMLHGHYQHDFSLFLGMALNNVTCGLVTVPALKYRQR